MKINIETETGQKLFAVVQQSTLSPHWNVVILHMQDDGAKVLHAYQLPSAQGALASIVERVEVQLC